MKNNIVIALSVLFLCACQQSEQDKSIRRIDRPEASILKGVFVPEGKDLFYTSGLVSEVLNEQAELGDMSKYGDALQQSRGALKRVEETLSTEGYMMKDVIFLRVYLAPDSTGNINWQAWFTAYGEYFNNEENPNKVARSTIGVYKLARPELLVEVEAVAAK